MLTRIHILLLCSGFLFVGCGQKSARPVQFVVPDHFTGVIQLILDTNSGVTLKPSDGRYVVVVPATGKLSITSFEPFDTLHPVSAVYASGASLPVEVGPSGTNGIVALHVPGKQPRPNDDSEFDYLIGTPEDAQRFYR